MESLPPGNEQASPTQHTGETENAPHERQQHLQTLIELSRSHTMSRGYYETYSFNATPTETVANAWNHLEAYRKSAKEYEHRLAKEDVAKAAEWSAKIIRSTLLQTPEFQEHLPEKIAAVRQKNQLFPVDSDKILLPEDFGTGKITRGDTDWQLSRGKYDVYTLSRTQGPVIEEVVVASPKPDSRIGEPAVFFTRIEDLDESVALMQLGNTEEAFAAAENILTQYRNEVRLQELPKGLFKASDTVWKRLVKSPKTYAGGAVLGAGGGLQIYTNPSLEASIVMGIAGAKIGHGVWKDVTAEERELQERAKQVIQTGEFEWGHPTI